MGGPYYPPRDDVAYFCRVATFSHVSFVPLNFPEVSPTVFGVKSEPPIFNSQNLGPLMLVVDPDDEFLPCNEAQYLLVFSVRTEDGEEDGVLVEIMKDLEIILLN
ncbi:hypothetical protein C1H46_032251 [Malus baccata]|uniref:Uncharacterized protein n=1 Tax=Malus baccata TaxID=106549 RepID=A0A540L6Q1_MALBA|nr:hypothetical protein C1H46_032251 [Malus baccata]